MPIPTTHERLLRKLRATPDTAPAIGPVHGRALRPEPGKGIAALFTRPHDKFVPARFPKPLFGAKVSGPPFKAAPLAK